MISDGTYALADTVGSDWSDFERLAHFGVDHDDPEGTAALERALDLVRGGPPPPPRTAMPGPNHSSPA